MACCFLAFVNSYLNWLRFLIFDLKSAFGCLTYNILSFVIIISIYSFQGTIWLVLILSGSLDQSYIIRSFLSVCCLSQITGPVFFSFWFGGHLLSHAVSNIVPSAAQVLTIVFGMGTGVSPERIATGNICVAMSKNWLMIKLMESFHPYLLSRRSFTLTTRQ